VRKPTQRASLAILAVLVLVAVAALLLALLGGNGGKSGGRVTWKVASSPFALEVLRGGTQLLSDATGPAGPGSRLSYTLEDGSQHTLTSLIDAHPVAGGTAYRVKTDEPGRTSTVTVTRRAHSIHVAWRLVPASGVATVYSAFKSPAASEHFVGAGIDHFGVDLNGQLVQLKVAYSCARSIVTPFFASSAGYGVYYDTNAVGHMQFRGNHDGMACDDSNSANPLCTVVPGPDRVQACFKASSLDYDIFTGTPAAIVAAYRVTAGRMPMPQAAEFAAIKWRDRVSGSAALLDDVAQFRRLGIPLGTILLDNPWETDGCWGALRFDPRFGDPATLIRKLRADDIRLMVWVSPWVRNGATCRSLSRFPAGSTLLTPQGWDAVDFTNPAARADYESKIAALVRLGVAGFKGDRGDETDLESLTFEGGPGKEENNPFPELFARSVLAGSRAAGMPAPVTMFRAGYTGTPSAGAGVWAGDQSPDFAGLQDAIHSLASLGASGFALTGSDVGGYATQSGAQILTANVFARWSQLGAISPIFEVGGADRAAQFWKLGATATTAARDSVRLHYDLFPYLYSLARASSRTGSPILQPLGLVYPNDEEAWRSDLELLVGDDLLAAPVTSASGIADTYLPKETWVDLYSGTSVDGGTHVKRVLPLSQFPLYLRAGATIRFNLREADLWQRAWPLDALQLPGRAGWLSAASKVQLSGAPKESEVLFARSSPASSVRVDGRQLQRFASVAALRQAAEGWVWNTKPFPGVLVKVAPRSGAANVSLRG
jgi:alpha-D-xyloside xylohydrolase